MTIIRNYAKLYTQETGVYMKTFQYQFNYVPEVYNYIMRNIYLSEDKREKEILELCRMGKNCAEIAERVGFSERTIQRRRQEINNKIQDVILM